MSSWKVGEILHSLGDRCVLRLEGERGNVEMRGPEGALLELAGILDAGAAALDRARETLSVGKVAYHVVFAAPAVGIDSVTIALPAPGIRYERDVQAVAAAIRKSVGLPEDARLTVMSWTEIERHPQIEIAQAIPAGVPLPSSNLVS